MKFYQWYSQALGSIIGMISCMYCYLRGDILLYYNLTGNYDTLTFNKIVASYTLYPLCIVTFLLSLIIALIPNCMNNKIFGVNTYKVNSFLKYLTVIIGILGCGIYFIPPIFILLFAEIISIISFIKNKLNRKKELAYDNCYNNQSKEYDITHIIEETNNLSEDKHILTKTEIAIHLLNKDSNIDFITDITGLPLDYINKLKKEAVHSQSEK